MIRVRAIVQAETLGLGNSELCNTSTVIHVQTSCLRTVPDHLDLPHDLFAPRVIRYSSLKLAGSSLNQVLSSPTDIAGIGLTATLTFSPQVRTSRQDASDPAKHSRLELIARADWLQGRPFHHRVELVSMPSKTSSELTRKFSPRGPSSAIYPHIFCCGQHHRRLAARVRAGASRGLMASKIWSRIHTP